MICRHLTVRQTVTAQGGFHTFPDETPDNAGRKISAVRDDPEWTNHGLESENAVTS